MDQIFGPDTDGTEGEHGTVGRTGLATCLKLFAMERMSGDLAISYTSLIIYRL